MASWPDNLPRSQTHPPVSIVTPTYNRGKFLPMLFECILQQTYPRERMEWLIYDDGTASVEALIPLFQTKFNIRYFRQETKTNIGAKRNRLHDEARGEIIVCMDDDDFYSADRVSHAVQTLLSKKTDICGASRNHLFFTDDSSIWEVGPYAPNHATFGTMAFRKQFTKDHRCDEHVVFAEEVDFTAKYTARLAQLDPLKVMLVMCHSENTFNKHKLRTTDNPHIRKTALKLKHFIRVAKLRDFYSNA
jgi:glycosyltransferase involved in cell wall biosynthesis